MDVRRDHCFFGSSASAIAVPRFLFHFQVDRLILSLFFRFLLVWSFRFLCSNQISDGNSQIGGCESDEVEVNRDYSSSTSSSSTTTSASDSSTSVLSWQLGRLQHRDPLILLILAMETQCKSDVCIFPINSSSTARCFDFLLVLSLSCGQWIFQVGDDLRSDLVEIKLNMIKRSTGKFRFDPVFFQILFWFTRFDLIQFQLRFVFLVV